MGRVWLQAATLAHTECALSLVKSGVHLEKNQTMLVDAGGRWHDGFAATMVALKAQR